MRAALADPTQVDCMRRARSVGFTDDDGDDAVCGLIAKAKSLDCRADQRTHARCFTRE